MHKSLSDEGHRTNIVRKKKQLISKTGVLKEEKVGRGA
jgi:hypothetical protein